METPAQKISEIALLEFKQRHATLLEEILEDARKRRPDDNLLLLGLLIGGFVAWVGFFIASFHVHGGWKALCYALALGGLRTFIKIVMGPDTDRERFPTHQSLRKWIDPMLYAKLELAEDLGTRVEHFNRALASQQALDDDLRNDTTKEVYQGTVRHWEQGRDMLASEIETVLGTTQRLFKLGPALREMELAIEDDGLREGADGSTRSVSTFVAAGMLKSALTGEANGAPKDE